MIMNFGFSGRGRRQFHHSYPTEPGTTGFYTIADTQVILR